MTPAQLRAARAFAGLKVDDLADAAQVAVGTISRFERGEGAMRRSTVAAVVRALETAGVEVTPDGGVKPRLPAAA